MSESTEQHDVISKLKALYLELGRPPKITDLVARDGLSKHVVTRVFGTFTIAMQAAGIPMSAEASQRKITNEIFIKNVEEHLAAHEPPEEMEPAPLPVASIISDIHWPFASQRVLDKFYRRVSDRKPEFVILNGDAWDMYSHAKFPRSHNQFTPREERSLARKQNQEFWEIIRREVPEAKCFQLLGNHDSRPMKRALETYPESEDWIREGLERDFSFEGVKTLFDAREELFLNSDTIIHHGYLSQLGAHRDYSLYNSINGHSHKGGVVFKRIRFQTLWELNSGYAGDPTAKGLTYTPQRINHWTPGFGETDPDGPRFVMG